jgi:hypothetical protein
MAVKLKSMGSLGGGFEVIKPKDPTAMRIAATTISKPPLIG